MILVLGASGRIGGYLFRRLAEEEYDVKGTYCVNRQDSMVCFDLETMTLDDLKLDDAPTHAVISAAANPRPELSRNMNDSFKANVSKSIHFIDSCFNNNIVPVYISSDNVFDGKKGNYSENDRTFPLNNYGRMKCEVEKHLISSDKPYVLLRMGKVFGIDDTLIFETYRNLKEGVEIPYAEDQIFTPSYAEDVYEFVRDIVEKNHQGIFHIGSTAAVTRHDVAVKIKEYFKIPNVNIIPCKINELGLSEKRPVKIDLNIAKYKALTGKKEREIEYFLERLIVEKDRFHKMGV